MGLERICHAPTSIYSRGLRSLSTRALLVSYGAHSIPPISISLLPGSFICDASYLWLHRSDISCEAYFQVGQAHTDVELPSYHQPYDTAAIARASVFLHSHGIWLPLFRSIIQKFIPCLINTQTVALAVGYANVHLRKRRRASSLKIDPNGWRTSLSGKNEVSRATLPHNRRHRLG